MKGKIAIYALLACAFSGINAQANVDFEKLRCGNRSTDFRVEFSKHWMGYLQAVIHENDDHAGIADCSTDTAGTFGYDESDELLLVCNSYRSAYGVVLIQKNSSYEVNIHLNTHGFPYFRNLPCKIVRE